MPSRQLAAIMFADMVGYTSLMQQNEQLAIRKRERCRKILEDSLQKYEGKLLQYYGDGALSIFHSGVNAVQSAIEIQTLSGEDPRIELRIGLHTGDVMIDENGVYGDSVNVSSRIESLSVAGSIFISDKLFDEVKNYSGISVKSLGFFDFKNVNQPMQVYAIANPGIVVPSREELKGKTQAALNGIAVLPFVNLSSDPENEFFCDGMAEELINVLSKVSGLQVISRTSAFAFKGRNEDIREIGAKLNVRKIIEGSVRKAGNRIRITAQLINAADGYHIWSETYDRNTEDIFEVQDEISRTIANKLRENLSTDQHQSKLAVAPTENMDAYKKFVHGMQMLDKVEAEERDRAIKLLKDAVKSDPHFVKAHALLAFNYGFMAETGQMSAQEANNLAHYHVGMAMQSDPSNPAAMTASSILLLSEWKWTEGFELLKQALEINPNDPVAHMTAAEYYVLFMDREKQIEHANMAYQLDPLSANTIGETARHYFTAGKIKEALELCEEALQLDLNNIVARSIRAYATEQMGDQHEALEQMKEIHKITGDHPLLLLGIGYVHARMNHKDEVLAIIDKLKSISADTPDTNIDYILAVLYLNIGDMQQFYRAYDDAFEKKSEWIVKFYGTESFRGAWYDEHVVASRKKLGLKVHERNSSAIDDN